MHNSTPNAGLVESDEICSLKPQTPTESGSGVRLTTIHLSVELLSRKSNLNPAVCGAQAERYDEATSTFTECLKYARESSVPDAITEFTRLLERGQRHI